MTRKAKHREQRLPDHSREHAATYVLGALLHAPSDISAKAVAWRSDPDVMLAWSLIGQNVYLHPDRRIMLTPGDPNRSIALSELAFAFELGLGPVSLPRSIDAGIGMKTFGVFSQQSVTDSATLHELLWSAQPDLVIEIGTFCGGSAIFFARTMEGYSARAKVITIDRTTFSSRREICRNPAYVPGPSGLESTHWKQLVAARRIIPIVARSPTASLVRMVAGHVANARGVFVSDDGDHLTEALLKHWVSYSRFVNVGSFYIVQDTRLEADCAYAMLTTRLGHDNWCRLVLRGGGPSAAVANITASPSFAREWVQDRSVEKWVLTQHPGGYFRRIAAVPLAPTTEVDPPGSLGILKRPVGSVAR